MKKIIASIPSRLRILAVFSALLAGAGTGLVSCGSSTPTSSGSATATPTATPSISVLATYTSADGPQEMCLDNQGNLLVAMATSGDIAKITSAGVTSLLYSGIPSANDVVEDLSQNLYVGTTGGHAVTEISSVGTFSTQGGTGASIGAGAAVAVNSAGTTLYVGDTSSGKIWQVNIGTGFASLLVSVGGIGSPACGLAFDSSGDLFVSVRSNEYIGEITAANLSGSPSVTSFAGTGGNGYLDGAAASAKFSNSYGIAVDSSGKVYVADYSNNAIRVISGGQVSTLIGPSLNNPTLAYTLDGPTGVAVDSHGDVYVSDALDYKIFKYVP